MCIVPNLNARLFECSRRVPTRAQAHNGSRRALRLRRASVGERSRLGARTIATRSPRRTVAALTLGSARSDSFGTERIGTDCSLFTNDNEWAHALFVGASREQNKTEQSRAKQERRKRREFWKEKKKLEALAHTQAASSYNGPHRQECAVGKHTNANM